MRVWPQSPARLMNSHWCREADIDSVADFFEIGDHLFTVSSYCAVPIASRTGVPGTSVSLG